MENADMNVACLQLPITINQRASFVMTVQLEYLDGTPVDLTGFTAMMQVRQTPTNEEVVVELSTDNGRITFPEPTEGKMQLYIPADVTAALAAPFAGVYDCLLTSVDNIVARVLQGPAIVSPGVTNEEEE